jgi:hypothetical protein
VSRARSRARGRRVSRQAPSGAGEPEPRRFRLSPTKLILSAGALAGALGSILALGGTVQGFLEDPAEGSVEILKIQSVRPLTYGQWRIHEGGSTNGLPPQQRGLKGKLILYRVETAGFSKNTRLPVRYIVHDVTAQRTKVYTGDAIRVVAGNDCGCDDWVPTPRAQARYFVEIQIFPPGPIRGEPEWSESTAEFLGS